MVDYDGYCACTLFTGACNFRCPFCQNAALVTCNLPSPVPEEEIDGYLKKRKNLLDALVITGGEPTLHPDLPTFLKSAKEKYGYRIKLDTNGSNPEMLKELIKNKLIDYVAMDIKNSLNDYDISVGIERFDTEKIEQSAHILLQNAVDYEFRTTLVEELHSERNIKDIALWLQDGKRYFLQKFEDKGGNIAEGLHAVPKETAEIYKGILSKTISSVSLRGY